LIYLGRLSTLAATIIDDALSTLLALALLSRFSLSLPSFFILDDIPAASLATSSTCQPTTATDLGPCVIDALPAVLLPITMSPCLHYLLIARALLLSMHKEHIPLQTHLLVLCLLLESTPPKGS
jgi:hypothetical protein